MPPEVDDEDWPKPRARKPKDDVTERTRAAFARQWAAMCFQASRPPPHLDDDADGEIAFDVNVPTSVRGLVATALHLADHEGRVWRADLERVTGLTTKQVNRSVTTAQEFGLLRRIVWERPARIRLAYAKIVRGGWQTCEHCPRPVVIGADGRQRYCAPCMALIVRRDRTWRAHAFEVWAGRKACESESSIIYKIHAQTKQPLFTRHARVDVANEDSVEGIVNWMLRTGLIEDVAGWTRRVRAFGQGDEGED